jgi:hypothetical protein
VGHGASEGYGEPRGALAYFGRPWGAVLSDEATAQGAARGNKVLRGAARDREGSRKAMWPWRAAWRHKELVGPRETAQGHEDPRQPQGAMRGLGGSRAVKSGHRKPWGAAGDNFLTSVACVGRNMVLVS